jgi:hypothetical protein
MRSTLLGSTLRLGVMRSLFNKQLFVASVLSSCAALSAAPPTANSCTSSQITLPEAETLLQATAELTALRRYGGKPVIFAESGGPQARVDFFYFVVYDAGPRGKASADGGLIGYFAVQKDTAKVFDTILAKQLDDERTLTSLGSKMRRKHCVTDRVLEKWRDVWP